MATSAVGIIFTNLHEENVPELVRKRTMGSIPYGGRYRIIDFPLSNMVNSNITTVGLMSNNNYSSLIDHLGSGKEWDLARKDGGIVLLPPFSDESDKPYSTRMEAINGLSTFLSHRREKYVVLCDSDHVSKMDYSAVIAYHEQKNADITVVTHFEEKERTLNCLFVVADENDRVREFKFVNRVRENMTGDAYAGVMVMNRELLISIIEDSIALGYSSFEKDVLSKQVNGLKIFRYDFKGYYASMDSMKVYFKHNLELLNKEVRKDLFSDHNIYTKVKDSAPSKCGENAVVKNSLISDGCEIEGVVENSILFRGVKVGKGAVVKNSIVMQDSIIEDSASLNCVITDKNVVITKKRTLSGCAELPYYIQKGTKL